MFSVMFCFNQTVLNPDFIVAEINKVNFTTTVTHILDEVWEVKSDSDTSVKSSDDSLESFEQYTRKKTIQTFSRLEPDIKNGIDLSVHSTFDYLLDKKPEPEMAKMLRESFFTKKFASSLIDNFELDSMIQQFVGSEKSNSKIKEVSNEAFSSLVDAVLAYLFLEKEDIDLKTEIANTILNTSFFTSFIDDLNIPDRITDPVVDSMVETIEPGLPKQMSFIIIGLRNSKPELTNWTRTELIKSSKEITEYLTGQKKEFSLTFSIDNAVNSIKSNLKTSFAAALPEELKGKPETEINAAFDQLLSEAFAVLPESIVIDNSIIGDDVLSSFNTLITENETELKLQREIIQTNIQAFEVHLKSLKSVIGTFLFYYNLILIAIVVLLSMLMGLNTMRGETKREKLKYMIRGPGITFAFTGFVQLLFVGAIKSTVVSELQALSLGSSMLGSGIIRLVDDALSSMLWLSISFVVVGTAVAIGSFFLTSKKLSADQPAETQEEEEPASLA